MGDIKHAPEDIAGMVGKELCETCIDNVDKAHLLFIGTELEAKILDRVTASRVIGLSGDVACDLAGLSQG